MTRQLAFVSIILVGPIALAEDSRVDFVNAKPVVRTQFIQLVQPTNPPEIIERPDESAPADDPRSGSPDDPLSGLLKPIDQVTTVIKPPRDDDGEKLRVPLDRKPPTTDQAQDALYLDMAYFWEPPGVCHRPLYFEQTNVERYGYSRARDLQQTISVAHFFGNVPLLPYKLALRNPRQCVYTLGLFRPGSVVPYFNNRLPLQLRAAGAEVATIAALFLIIP